MTKSQILLAQHLLRKHMKRSVYNQSLVRRGEILIGFDIINNWETELKKDEQRQGWIRNHFIIPIHFFFYLVMLKRTFIFLIDKLRRYCTGGHTKGKIPSMPDYRQ